MLGVAERTLALKLIGDVSGLRKDLKPAQRQIGQFTKGLASWGKALAGGVLIGGVERLAGSLRDAWDGYRSGEKAAAQLRKTWKNLGLQGKSYRSVLDKVTASTLKLGTSDDEAVEAFSRSLSRTRDYKQSLRELAIAQDLVASGAATNLESAFRIIQQAGKGSARVVDRFGLDSKTAAGRIRELGRQVEGTARTKAKLDPLGVLFNRMSEDIEGIVGSFAKGNFKGVLQGIQGLGETVADALFGPKGKDNIRNSKKAGLVNQFGGWASTVAKSIQDEFAKVDWAKTISDTLNSAIKALTTAGANGTLSTLATIGAGIAAAIFAVDLFLTAAKVPFAAANWAVGTAVDIAARGVGTLLGKAMASAMWLVSRLVDAAALTFGTLAKNEKVLGASRGLGASVGGSIISGIVAGMTGVLAIAAISQAITKATTSAEADWVKRSGLPDSPFKWPWQEGGFFFPKNAKGTSNWRGGPTWVGEEGPELVNVPRGASITPHRQSMAMAGGGSNYSISVYVAPGGDLVEAGRQMVRAIQQYEKRAGQTWRN